MSKNVVTRFFYRWFKHNNNQKHNANINQNNEIVEKIDLFMKKTKYDLKYKNIIPLSCTVRNFDNYIIGSADMNGRIVGIDPKLLLNLYIDYENGIFYRINNETKYRYKNKNLQYIYIYYKVSLDNNIIKNIKTIDKWLNLEIDDDELYNNILI